MPTVAHFILGYSAAHSLKQAFPDAKIVGMADHFDVGPCRFEGMTGITSWLHHRNTWWRQQDVENSAPFFFHGFGDCQTFEDAIAEIDTAILWVAEGAVEQLHACWLASALPAQVERFHGQPENRFENLPTLFVGFVRSEVFAETPSRSISADEQAAQSELWQAFVETSPLRFFELARRAAGERLTCGLHALVSHFPNRSTGLTDFESLLLTEIARRPGERCIRAVGQVLGLPDGPVLPNDSRLLDTLFAFEEAGLLLEVKSGDYARDSVFQFTDLGSKILKGEVNRVDAIGYDRWFGGTHISSADDNMWWRVGDEITQERS